MKLPYCEKAIIDDGKVLGYLLNLSHPDGWSKARFFMQLGFNQSNWNELVIALKEHAQNAEVERENETLFGRKYVVIGDLLAKTGKPYKVRSVWFIGYNEDMPKLVTVYPAK